VNNDGGFNRNYNQLQDVVSTPTDNQLLTEIRNLLQTMSQRLAGDADSNEPNHEDDNKNDWKLAAAVVDRILLVIFIIILVVGTIVFVGIIANR